MLSEYNFEIRHIKGTSNRCADALSQRPDYDQGQNDNQNVTILPKQVFTRAMEVLPSPLVMFWLGLTLDSAVMTTRAEM
jgi:hypothetical protein